MLENLLKAIKFRKCQKIARKSKNARKSIRGSKYPKNNCNSQKTRRMLEILKNARNS